MKNKRMLDQNIEGHSEDLELPFFSLTTIAIATNNFSRNNKLGEGGFGLVYKILQIVHTCILRVCDINLI
ncbi:receptor-like serine/threonine-protein kinase sd1-8 [Quercus suber]|uniref:Receptor-like serine/threonine-protein kinase sd1-8 n=1 Tax=Quercus suber TaxID=58331 RepID=A0AAW0LDI8_QUESU